MKKSLFSDKYGIILLLSFVWIYIVLRAIFTPVIHDEAETFFIYIQTGNFLPPDAYVDANNHVLNSLLTFGFYKLFGSELFVLRLANVLAGLIYFYFIYKSSQLVKNRLNRWVFVIALTFIHFVIEFFAYSRGYGLSMAFLMGALYYLMRFVKHPRFRFQALASLYIALAATANLTLLNSYILLHVIIFFGLLVYRKSIPLKIIVATLASQLLLWLPVLYLLLRYSLTLRSAGALYYGSSDGFLSVTAGSLSKVLFRPAPEILLYVLNISFIASLIVFALLLLKRHLFVKEYLFTLVFPVMLGGNLIMTLLLSLFFGVNYPEDRAAMYFILLFAGTVVVLSEAPYAFIKRVRWLLFFPFLLISAQFFMSLSLKFSSYTPEYRIPNSFYDYIMHETAIRPFPPVVEAYKEHRTEWYFTHAANHVIPSPLSYAVYPSSTAEFLITDEQSYSVFKKNYNEVLFDDPSGMYLLQRKQPLNLFQTAYCDTSMLQEDVMEYFNLLIYDADSMKCRNALFNIEISVCSQQEPFQAAIIAKAVSSDGTALRELAFEFERVRLQWPCNEVQVIRTSMLLPDLPAGTTRLILFFFNKTKSPFTIRKASTTLNMYD